MFLGTLTIISHNTIVVNNSHIPILRFAPSAAHDRTTLAQFHYHREYTLRNPSRIWTIHFTMLNYIKSGWEGLPQNFRSFSSAYRPSVSTFFQGKADLPSKNPKALAFFAIVLLLLFWKDILRDACSSVAICRTPHPLVQVSPIRNNTLGVGLPVSLTSGCVADDDLVSKLICPVVTRTR